MLILTRRQNERIFIGDDIEVKVLKLGEGQVKLGIEAPHGVHILRAELMEGENCTRDDCNWVDARNKAVTSGEICTTCNRLRAGNRT